MARYNYANCSKQKGIPTDAISESMGHKNLVVTKAYLRSLDSLYLENAMEVLASEEKISCVKSMLIGFIFWF